MKCPMHGNDDDSFLFPFLHLDFTNIPTGWSWGTDKNQIHGGFEHDIIKVGYLMEVLVTWMSIRTSLRDIYTAASQ